MKATQKELSAAGFHFKTVANCNFFIETRQDESVRRSGRTSLLRATCYRRLVAKNRPESSLGFG
jgi:hypothetical protein